MAYNRDFEVIEEQVAKYLSSTVNRVKNEEDVDVLASLTKLIKKNVPLSLRKQFFCLYELQCGSYLKLVHFDKCMQHHL